MEDIDMNYSYSHNGNVLTINKDLIAKEMIAIKKFKWISNITHIKIKKNVLDKNAIKNIAQVLCEGVSYIDVDSNNNYFFSFNGILLDKNKSEIIMCPKKYPDKIVSIPNTIKHIGEKSFFGCKSLTNIIIPDSVESIGNYAFSFCESLNTVVIPNSVMSIGKFSFDGCKMLTSIVIPDSVRSIGDYAFSFCESLNTVVIPNSVKSIGVFIFEGCKSLSSICAPDSFRDVNYFHNRKIEIIANENNLSLKKIDATTFDNNSLSDNNIAGDEHTHVPKTTCVVNDNDVVKNVILSNAPPPFEPQCGDIEQSIAKSIINYIEENALVTIKDIYNKFSNSELNIPWLLIRLFDDGIIYCSSMGALTISMNNLLSIPAEKTDADEGDNYSGQKFLHSKKEIICDSCKSTIPENSLYYCKDGPFPINKCLDCYEKSLNAWEKTKTDFKTIVLDVVETLDSHGEIEITRIEDLCHNKRNVILKVFDEIYSMGYFINVGQHTITLNCSPAAYRFLETLLDTNFTSFEKNVLFYRAYMDYWVTIRSILIKYEIDVARYNESIKKIITIPENCLVDGIGGFLDYCLHLISSNYIPLMMQKMYVDRISFDNSVYNNISSQNKLMVYTYLVESIISLSEEVEIKNSNTIIWNGIEKSYSVIIDEPMLQCSTEHDIEIFVSKCGITCYSNEKTDVNKDPSNIIDFFNIKNHTSNDIMNMILKLEKSGF